jgi:hypothetical protein
MAMKPEVLFGDWYACETSCGTEFVPASLFRDGVEVTATDLAPYCEGTIDSFERQRGWGARLSMPGYLDATDWTVYATEQQARASLVHDD